MTLLVTKLKSIKLTTGVFWGSSVPYHADNLTGSCLLMQSRFFPGNKLKKRT